MEKTRIVLALFVLISLAILNWALPSQAAITTNPIIVTTNQDVMDAFDGACSLREALHNANTNSLYSGDPGECAAGSATQTDLIVLQSNTTYQLAIAGNGDDEGDLDVLSDGLPLDIRFETSGGGLATIQMTLVGQRVMEIHGATVAIENVVFSGGNHPDMGGGIYNNGGTLSLYQSHLQANSANAGGGLYNNNGTVFVDETAVTGNGGTLGGGGLFNSNGTMTISNSSLEFNDASGGSGGAIVNLGGTLLITGTTRLELNMAGFNGGGILNDNGDLILNNTLVKSNMTSEHGGGIYNENGQVTITHNSNIDNNEATQQGGGIYSWGNNAALLIENSIIQSNRAGWNGGGIDLHNHDAVLTNNAIYDNKASQGGGIYLAFNSSLTITGGQIHDNEAITWNVVLGYGPTTIMETVSPHGAGSKGGGILSYGQLSIIGTQIYNNAALNFGGGVALEGSAASNTTLSDVNINNNQAPVGGGISIASSGQAITVENSIITLNQAIGHNESRGGGIYHSNHGGDLTITGSQIANNEAHGNGADNGGGAIFNGENSNLMVSDNTVITGNEALQAGGGGILNLGTAVIEDSTISNNHSTSGGGIGHYYGNAYLTVRSTLVSDNSSTSGWGGGIDAFGQTIIEDSTITGNQSGGGIRFSYTTSCDGPPQLRILNTTISHNNSISGGGIRIAGTAEILHTTITKNSATTAGNGIHATNNETTCVSLGHTIISGNDSDIPDDIAAENTVQRYISLGHNMIGQAGNNVDFTLDFTENGDVTNVFDPGLAPLDDNGGPMPTHALLADSLAIGRGDPAVCADAAGVNGVDQRGFLRDGVACDSGAYEYGLTLSVALAGDGDGSVSSDPTGIDCAAVNCVQKFVHDTAVSLTATPATDQFFVHWTGAVSSSNPTIVVTMDAAKNVTAVFSDAEPIRYLYLPLITREAATD